MALVFFLTFTIGDWLKGYFEAGLELLTGAAGSALEAWGVSPALQSLLVDGIISGVGGILTFLPNIFILFLALAFLEDSGYMSRVAFVMDGIMGKLGLSGRAFLPMLLGHGADGGGEALAGLVNLTEITGAAGRKKQNRINLSNTLFCCYFVQLRIAKVKRGQRFQRFSTLGISLIKSHLC